jgi:uncharacterized protein DUF3551
MELPRLFVLTRKVELALQVVEVLMRVPILAILAAGAVYGAAPAQAQTYDPNYPFCVQVYQSFVDYYFDCTYRTMAQCQMSASGRAASCVVNPYYAGPRGRPGPRHRRSYRH